MGEYVMAMISALSQYDLDSKHHSYMDSVGFESVPNRGWLIIFENQSKQGFRVT